MDDFESATPVKMRTHDDEVSVTTPSGGLIFNPFHKEFLSRLGQVTFSPGIFATNLSPIHRSDSKKGTPSRASLPFLLSPDMQGDLFPADIDENPVLQLKLQEKLDTQCDDDIQDTIHSFFKSHLIAPSPDTHSKSPLTHRSALPRTSSLLPTATPKSKKTKNFNHICDPRVNSYSVAVQTALTIPPDYDFEEIIKSILIKMHEGQSVSLKFSPSLTTSSTIPDTLYSEHYDKRDNSPNSGHSVSPSSCAVQRSRKNRVSSFSDLQHRHAPTFSRRSLFCDSSLISCPNDTCNNHRASISDDNQHKQFYSINMTEDNCDLLPVDESDASQKALIQMAALMTNANDSDIYDDDRSDDNMNHGLTIRAGNQSMIDKEPYMRLEISARNCSRHDHFKDELLDDHMSTMCCSHVSPSNTDCGNHLYELGSDSACVDVSFHSPNFSPILPKPNVKTTFPNL